MGKFVYRGSAPPDHPVFSGGFQVFVVRRTAKQRPAHEDDSDSRQNGAAFQQSADKASTHGGQRRQSDESK